VPYRAALVVNRHEQRDEEEVVAKHVGEGRVPEQVRRCGPALDEALWLEEWVEMEVGRRQEQEPAEASDHGGDQSGAAG
jgi:hypothetical protein